MAHLRWRILSGDFVSGEKIRELTLSREMDVSRAISCYGTGINQTPNIDRIA